MFLRVGEMLKVQDMNVILRHFGKLKRLQDISQLFVWMQQNRKLDVSSYINYIKFMGNNLDAEKMVEIYNSIQDESIKNNFYVCNSILSSLIKKGKFDSSIKLIQKMKEDGLMLDVVTYGTLLADYIKVKHGYPKALELIQDFQRNKLCMDDVIYGAILAVCASNSKWEEAELVILTTLLKVYVRGGLFDKSRELLTELEYLGYAEDETPYCSLMDGLAKAGQMKEAKLIFDEMWEKHVRSDCYAHSIMISAFCQSKLFEKAKQLANDFEATYNKYDFNGSVVPGSTANKTQTSPRESPN